MVCQLAAQHHLEDQAGVVEVVVASVVGVLAGPLTVIVMYLIELETKIAIHYAKFYNHGEVPSLGHLLVESGYKCFHI